MPTSMPHTTSLRGIDAKTCSWTAGRSPPNRIAATNGAVCSTPTGIDDRHFSFALQYERSNEGDRCATMGGVQTGPKTSFDIAAEKETCWHG